MKNKKFYNKNEEKNLLDKNQKTMKITTLERESSENKINTYLKHKNIAEYAKSKMGSLHPCSSDENYNNTNLIDSDQINGGRPYGTYNSDYLGNPGIDANMQRSEDRDDTSRDNYIRIPFGHYNSRFIKIPGLDRDNNGNQNISIPESNDDTSSAPGFDNGIYDNKSPNSSDVKNNIYKNNNISDAPGFDNGIYDYNVLNTPVVNNIYNINNINGAPCFNYEFFDNYENSFENDRDISYLNQLYPTTTKHIQSEIRRKLNYDKINTLMLAPYPNKAYINYLIEEIFLDLRRNNEMEKPDPLSNNNIIKEDYLRELIALIVLNELMDQRRMYRRYLYKY